MHRYKFSLATIIVALGLLLSVFVTPVVKAGETLTVRHPDAIGTGQTYDIRAELAVSSSTQVSWRVEVRYCDNEDFYEMSRTGNRITVQLYFLEDIVDCMLAEVRVLAHWDDQIETENFSIALLKNDFEPQIKGPEVFGINEAVYFEIVNNLEDRCYDPFVELKVYKDGQIQLVSYSPRMQFFETGEYEAHWRILCSYEDYPYYGEVSKARELTTTHTVVDNRIRTFLPTIYR